MKPFRGIRLFFYNLSAAGPALILTTVLHAGMSFFHPSLASLKNGLPRYLPPFLFGSLPPIAAVVCLTLLVRLIALPGVAFLSDRSASPLGKRRIFLLTAVPVFMTTAVLLFLAPTPELFALNFILLIVLAGIFAMAEAAYTVPYATLLPELGENEGVRHFMGTSQALFSVTGALMGILLLPFLQEAFQNQGPAGSLQLAALVSALIGALLSLGAPLSVRGYSAGSPARSTGSLGDTLRTVFETRSAKGYVVLVGTVWFALSVFFFSIPVIGSDLMLVDEYSTRVAVICFLVAAVAASPGIWWLAKKRGRRLPLTAAVGLLAVALTVLALTGISPNPAGLRWNCVTSVTETASGRMVFGTWRGVSVFHDGEWSSITEKDDLIDDRVTRVVGIPEGIWFGTLGGASFYDGEDWTHYSKASGLIDNRVLSIIPRGEGVWFLTPKGVSHFENATFSQFIPEPDAAGRETAPLTSLVLGELGDLWVGSDNGLFRFSESGWTKYDSENGLPDATVTSLAIAPNHDVLAGTYGGLARFSPSSRSWTTLTEEDGLPSNIVLSIQTENDQIFICTEKGVYVTDGHGNERVLTAADGLAHDRVRDVHTASNGTIWFATENGVSAFANGLWTTYQYPLPRIWGLLGFILLGFALAALVVLSPLIIADLADAVGPENRAMATAFREMARTGGAVAGGVVTATFFSVFSQSLPDPVGVRLLLALGAAAAGLAVIGVACSPCARSHPASGKKER